MSASRDDERAAGNRRLESWKEIAAHLDRGVRTVQRWERREGLPTHRHAHTDRSSVYAYTVELDEWWRKRQPQPLPAGTDAPRDRRHAGLHRALLAAVLLSVACGAGAWLLRRQFIPSAPAVHPAAVARLLANLTREGATPLRVPAGREPCAAVLAPNGRELYVSDIAGDALVIIDTYRKSVARSIPLPGHPCALAISPDGDSVFVGRYDGRVTVVRTSNGSTRDIDVHSRVNDLLATPDGRAVYVATPYGGLWRLDVQDGNVEPVPVVGCPMNLASDGRSKLYVSFQCEGPGGKPGHDAVGIFDLASGRPIGHAQGPPQVGGPLAASPDAAFFWVNGQDACASIYDRVGCPQVSGSIVNVFQTADLSLARSLAVTSGGELAFLPGGRRVFLGGPDSLHVFDTRSFAIAEALGARAVGRPAVTADGRSAWAILENEAVAMDPLPGDCELPDSALTDLWTADGSADDLVSATVGQLHAGASFAPGIIGQAFAFDGSRGEITVGPPTLASWGMGDATLLAWVKFFSTQGEMPLVDNVDPARPSMGVGWRILKAADNHLRFCVGGDVAGGCNATGVFSVTSATGVRPGVWYHVAVTKRGDALSLYMNGRREATRASVTVTGAEPRGRRFGIDNAGHHLHGLLDEIAQYARALEPAEIERVYRNATAPACTGSK